MAPLRRFWGRVTFSDGCWTWSSVRKDGYGTFTVDGKCFVPHRWLWLQIHKQIPHGWTVDHLCHNRGCVRPSHLEAVPHAINIARARNHSAAVNAAKTHCPQGHPYSGDNLYVTPGKNDRRCKACARMRIR